MKKSLTALVVSGLFVHGSVLSVWAVYPPDNSSLVPDPRRTDWRPGIMVGVPNGIPTTRTNVINVVTQFGADNSGSADAQPAIQNAIAAAHPEDIIFLPAGRYRINNMINVTYGRNHLTLRGAGVDLTTIDCRTSNRCMEIGVETNPPVGDPILSGLAKDSSQITVGNTANYSVGQLIQISVADDVSLPVVHVSSWKGLRSQMVRVTSKTSNTLGFWPPLYSDYGRGSLAATVSSVALQNEFNGVEDLTIDASNGTSGFGIIFSQTYGSWIKNVKIRHSSNYSVFFMGTLNCEMRHSYLDELNHAGSNGAGLLMWPAWASLIEDNIIYKSFPLIEINGSSSGNVIAYNFTEESQSYGIMGAGIDGNHGPHNSYNLYEGNISNVFQSDGYFGSDSDETIFRNWIHATDPTTDQFGRAIGLNRLARNYSIVGNVLGRSGNDPFSGKPLTYVYMNTDNAMGNDVANIGTGYDKRYIYNFGLPNIGNGGFSGYAQLSKGRPWADWNTVLNSAPGAGPGPSCCQELDLDVQATVLLKGNWNAVDQGVRAAEKLGAGEILPNSLYLGTKPGWFGSLSWPPFDPTNPNQNYDAIPAGYRYVLGAEAPGVTANPPSAPVIYAQPQDQTVVVGAAANFSVQVVGTAPLSYLWKRNGVDIIGATDSTYTTPVTTMTDTGSTFSCVISNSLGSATSRSATLTVLDHAPGPVDVSFLPFKNIFNPTKETLTITYTPMATNVNLTIYDRTGNEVRNLEVNLNGRSLWDGRNASGSIVATGTYIAILKQGGKMMKKKVVVVK